jgi:hypothetical protein
MFLWAWMWKIPKGLILTIFWEEELVVLLVCFEKLESVDGLTVFIVFAKLEYLSSFKSSFRRLESGA